MKKVGGTIFIIVLLSVIFFLDWYVFQGIKTILPSAYLAQGKTVYWVLTAAIAMWFGYTFYTIMQEGNISSSSQQSLNWFLVILVTQLTVVLFLFGEDLIRGLGSVYRYATNYSNEGTLLVSRRKFVSQLAFAVAAIPMTGFIYGIVKGKYAFRTIRKTLYFKDLPEAFDGFTITQLSDIHAGSFKDIQAVKKGAEMAAAQQSDLFVFTGDLVNHKANEIDPMLDVFSKIKAPYGQFSILGNHDYGDYTSWPSPEAKAQNLESLKNKHQLMGFDLLLDESRTIEKDGQKISLLGVENWGIGFQSKGDLEKSLQNVPEKDFKILLSHDPTHWDEQVKNHPKNIHLTLSGHTHGMQMGIETPFIRWSPAQYRYTNWAGIAEQTGKYLYVNRGFGFHAFAGRVGIWPEITVIELKKA